MSGRARYAAILRTPHVAPLLVASMLARLPFGMYALSLVLYLAHERDSFAVGGLVALTEAGAPTAALMACALIGGFAIPNIGAALRALWPELLRRREDLVSAAFALDSVAIELLFTVGPLIAAGIIAVISPIAALAQRRLHARGSRAVRRAAAVARL